MNTVIPQYTELGWLELFSREIVKKPEVLCWVLKNEKYYGFVFDDFIWNQIETGW